MTLNELLKVVDDNTRIQIRLKMFGSTFSTNRYKNYLLNDEKEAKLLVKLGSTGTSVLLLQEILIARGFKGKNGKALALSRKADENTIYALKAYQKSRNEVLTVDGECGEKTWKDLIAI